MAYVSGLGTTAPPRFDSVDAARAAFNEAIDKAVARGAPADIVTYWRSAVDVGPMRPDDYSTWVAHIRAWRPGKNALGVAAPAIFGVDPLAVGFVVFAVGLTGWALCAADKRR